MATTSIRSEKITSPEYRVSYPAIFAPKASSDEKGQPTGKSKYSNVMLIAKKGNEEAIKAIKVEIGRLAMEYFGEDKVVDGVKKKVIPKTVKNPLKDGDEKYNEDPEKNAAYQGMWFMNAGSIDKPGLVDHNNQAIISPNEFYAGCYARCTFNLYTYDKPMSKGIAVGLQNIQKLRDGEPLGSGKRTKAEDDFDAAPSAASSDDDMADFLY